MQVPTQSACTRFTAIKRSSARAACAAVTTSSRFGSTTCLARSIHRLASASTAAGSTGWMYQEGGEVIPIDDPRVQYISRSVRGETPGFASEIRLEALTHEAAIYIDGTESVTEAPLGTTVTFRPGTSLTVVGDLATKRQQLEEL